MVPHIFIIPKPIMKTTLKITVLITLATLLQACSTIINGPNAQVTITGEIPDTLNIKTYDKNYEDVTLPQTVEVKRRKLAEPIRVSTDSTEIAIIFPGKKIDPWVWGDILGFGGFGLAVDFATGNVYKPAKSTFELKPYDGKTQVLFDDLKNKTRKLYRHELTFGFGIYTNLRDGRFRNLQNDMKKNHGFVDVPEEFCGIDMGPVSLRVGYFYHLNRKWAVGLQYSYSMFNDFAMEKQIDQNSRFFDNIRANAHAFLVGGKFNWFDYMEFSLYSRAALGLMHRQIKFNPRLSYSYSSPEQIPICPPTTDNPTYYTNVNEKKWLPAYQISPIGLEAGRGMLRFFMEFGYGIDGVFSFGLNFNF